MDKHTSVRVPPTIIGLLLGMGGGALLALCVGFEVPVGLAFGMGLGALIGVLFDRTFPLKINRFVLWLVAVASVILLLMMLETRFATGS